MSGSLPPSKTPWIRGCIRRFPDDPQRQLVWLGRLLREVCAEAASAPADITDRWRYFGGIERERAEKMIEALSFAQRYVNRPIVSAQLRDARSEISCCTKHSLVDLFAWLRQALEKATNAGVASAESGSDTGPLDGRIPTDIINAAELASKLLSKRPTSDERTTTSAVSSTQQINIQEINVTQQTDICHTSIQVSAAPASTQAHPESSNGPADGSAKPVTQDEARPNEPSMGQVRYTLNTIPALEEPGHEWIMQEEAASATGYSLQYLRNIRSAYDRSAQRADDKCSGIDPLGQVWRKQRFRDHRIFYLKSTLSKKTSR